MLGTQESVFRFGDVEVREREFRLIKAGEVIPVEPKAFRVLLFLLHNPQKLITKEELLNAVWGETAVSENSLTRSIALLRRILADDTHVPRYIETVATVGYRFVCPVELSEDAHGDLASADLAKIGNGIASEMVPAETQGRASWIHPRRWLTAVVVVAVGLFVSAIWYLHHPLPPLRVTEYTQITYSGGQMGIVGTDGARLYLNNKPFPSQVAVSGGEITPMPVGLPNPWLLDVSPDGSTILISSLDGNPWSLWSVRVPESSLRHLAEGLIHDARWSPDGQRVIYSTEDGDRNVIKVMRGDGTEPRELASLPAGRENAAYDLSWSPDGHSIRFTRDLKYWEMLSDGSGLRPLLPGWRTSFYQCCGHWTPDGRFFVFLLLDSRIPTTMTVPAQFWALDERRGLFGPRRTEPIQLTSGPIRWARFIPSKDGRKIFATGVISRGELERYDAQTHELRPYLGGVCAEHVAFSPDGQFIAYVTFPEGILWRANRDGSNPEQLTSPPLYPTMPRWSPDGSQFLFFALDEDRHVKSYLLPAHGGTPHPILPEDKDPQSDPSWSPDGHKIVFSSVGTSILPGPHDVIRILDLAAHQISTLPGSEGTRSPRWSPDGRFIAVLSASNNGLKVFDLETQRWSVLQKEGVGFPTWSRDSKFIYFLRYLSNDVGVFRIRPSGGDAERVVDLKGFRHTGVYQFWFGLDPTDTPLLLRDIGTQDIYALSLEEK